jgi:hypothetical protein
MWCGPVQVTLMATPGTNGTNNVAKNKTTSTGTTITLSNTSRYSTSPAAANTTSNRQLQAANRPNAGGTSGRCWVEGLGSGSDLEPCLSPSRSAMVHRRSSVSVPSC